MLQKTEAIVLHSLKYGEQRVIVDMFTRSHGRLAFIVPLPRSARSTLKKQYFQPLTLLTIEMDVRPQQQLQKLKDASLLSPLSALLSTPDKLAIGLFVAEFLYHALKGEQQNEPLFEYVLSSLQWLDGAPDRYANFHLVFLMRLSRFLGFYPNLEERGRRSEEGGRRNEEGGAREEERGRRNEEGGARREEQRFFDLRAASFCVAPPLHRDFLMPAEASRLRLLMRMDYATMHLFRLSRTERNRIVELLLLYYRIHLPDFPELRSLGVLHELFQ